MIRGRRSRLPLSFMFTNWFPILGSLLLLVCPLSWAQTSGSKSPPSASSGQTREHALSLAKTGRCGEAVRLLQKVISQTSDKEFHRSAGLAGVHCAMVLNQFDAAEQAKNEFQQELEIDPSNAGAEYVLGELARQGQQWNDAIQHFTRAAKLDAGFGDAFLGWGAALVSTKKFSEAVAPLEAAVKLEPQNPGAHYNLAIAYTRTGRKEEGEREFAIHRDMVQKKPAEGAPPQEQPAAAPQ